MTNEEAQIVIGNIPLRPEVLDDCYSITEYQEAKAMAIEALGRNLIDYSELINLLYDNNVRCDQTIEGLADDIVSLQKNV